MLRQILLEDFALFYAKEQFVALALPYAKLSGIALANLVILFRVIELVS